MPATKVLQPEPAQPPRKTLDRVQTQRGGKGRTGLEKTKPERILPERAGPKRAGPEKTKPEKSGLERARTQRAGPERAGPERAGPERAAPGRVKAASDADGQLRVPAGSKGRARSCPRYRDGYRGLSTVTDREVPGTTARRTRSSTVATRPLGRWTRTEPEHRRSVRTEDPWIASEPVQREQRRFRTENSHKAFTVIPPNPKKRREIQRKAEAELAALEELRISRATTFVSINPSSVGGCMSLEEVRLKQQQEMLKAKRSLKSMKKQLLKETSVGTS